MNINQFYKGKSILVTGASGFLGKILIQKILFSLSDINKIYIIIRSKKGKSHLERFNNILEAKCFDRLKKKHKQNFKAFIQQKVAVFAGDIQKENLGLSKKDYQAIINDCQIFFANAANIKFDAPFHQEIQANIQGSLRTLQIAKKANAQIFTYTSTFAVSNHLKNGYVQQRIYDLKDKQGMVVDCQKLYQHLKSLSPQQLAKQSSSIIAEYNYPNVYAFCKGLCERMINLRRGNMPVAFIRPTMVYSTYKEPVPGWIDVLHAGEITFLFVGLGVLQEFFIDPYLQVDTVPGDVVVNNLIVSSAYHAGQNQLTVHHVSSIERNPILWKQMIYITRDFWKAYPTPKRVATPNVIVSKDEFQLKFHFYKRQLLLWFYIKFGPIFRPSQKKQIQRLDRLNQKAVKIAEIYKYGFDNFWVYENKGVDCLKQWLGTDCKQFLIDCADINMLYYFLLNNYGIKKFILKQQVEQIPKIILQSDRIELSVNKPKPKL